MDPIDRYIALLSEPSPDLDAIGDLLHPEVVFVEHPNLVSPRGHVRDRAAMLDGVRRGADLLTSQQFEVLERQPLPDDRHVIRLSWRGEVGVKVGAWTVGTVLEAQIAMFVELRQGRIWRQENYDCYLPPASTAA